MFSLFENHFDYELQLYYSGELRIPDLTAPTKGREEKFAFIAGVMKDPEFDLLEKGDDIVRCKFLPAILGVFLLVNLTVSARDPLPCGLPPERARITDCDGLARFKELRKEGPTGG